MSVEAAAIWAAAHWAAQFVDLDRYQRGHHFPVEVHHRRFKARTLSTQFALPWK